jgi:hypothetical protein
VLPDNDFRRQGPAARGEAPLGVVQAAYQRWAGANGHLQEQISKAAAQQTSPPIQALCADFDAQIDVTRAAIRFARVCPAEAPDLDGLPGPLLEPLLPPTDRGRPRSTLRLRPHLDRPGGTAATNGTTGTVDLAEEDHDVVWLRSCRL